MVGPALGLLEAFPRGAEGWGLLTGERSEGVCDQVRVILDHVLPARRLHNVRRVATERQRDQFYN